MTAEILKWIALVTMTIDHIAYHLVPYYEVAYDIMRAIGRIAMPIYCFLIAEGFTHTHSRKSYLLRLLLCTAVFELFFVVMYLVSGENYILSIDIFLTLSSGLGCLMLIKQDKLLLKLLVPVIMLISVWLEFDYGLYGIILILIFGLVKNKYLTAALFVLLNSLFVTVFDMYGIYFISNVTGLELQWFSLLALVPIFLYNGKLGDRLKCKPYKYFFYLYYPAHIGVIMLISYFLA